MKIPLIILILLLISVCLIWKNDNVEHMTVEAASNIASLFNGGNGTVKDLTVTGTINAGGNTVINNLATIGSSNVLGIQNKNTQWIIHPPDDERNSMWIAPKKPGSEWDWGNSIQINNQGNIKLKSITIGDWTISQDNRGLLRFHIGNSDGGTSPEDAPDKSAMFMSRDGNLYLNRYSGRGWIADNFNSIRSGRGEKRNGSQGYGWNAKCGLTTTPGGCTDVCPDGYYMSGISAGKEWDHKHPVCTKFS